MLISSLRLVGFKSFVDRTELLIEPGLTGVVGPNGCGKSNLLEALRWVMGETSYKSMRASAMDDVIFSGTTSRPARNNADVTILIDNRTRTAPAEFNDTDVLEITRRIEREQGSSYRINGREARAKDIKILFEDAATGARSPALVRQGQIGEIVNAKPEQRRRILEDAAGIAGLRSRRHDAELRLNAAENNLVRIGDVLGQMSAQIDVLRRQARQAKRYVEISDAVQRSEAAVLYLTWRTAATSAETCETAYRATLETLAAATGFEAQCTATEAAAAERLQPLREQEAERAAARARLGAEQETIARDIAAAEARHADLTKQQETIGADLKLEHDRANEARSVAEELTAKAQELGARQQANQERRANMIAEREHRDTGVRQADSVHADLSHQIIERESAERTADAQIAERRRNLERIEAQLADTNRQHDALVATVGDDGKLQAARDAVKKLEADLPAAETALSRAARDQDEASDARDRARDERQTTALALRALETEVGTLSRLLSAGRTGDTKPIIDQLDVADGYEAALAAALGDDLNASLESDASIYWSEPGSADPASDDPPLPDGIACLTNFVTGDGARTIGRRLAFIGVVDAADGARLQNSLKPGQRLVSRDGDLWRWDGLTMRAGAPTAAATRLEQRNRLQSLKRKLTKTRTTDAKAETAAASAHLAFEQARTALREHQSARDALQKRLDEARRTLEAAEREAAAETLRVETLSDRLAQLAADAADARAAIASAEDMRSALASADPLRPELEAIAKTRDVAREKAGEIAAALAGLESEVQQLAQQTKSMTADQNRWTERAAAAGRRIAELNGRATSVAEQLTDASTLPDQLRARAETLAVQVSAAEIERQRCADALAIAETELRDAQTTLRAAQTSVGEAREGKARDETRLEAARAALIDAANDIRQTLDAEPEMARARAGWDPDKTPDAELPDLESTTAKLQKMRSDRDRLGGVNLQAAEELDALEAEFTTRDAERADVEAAIAKLRGGIGQLNREARKRLLTAFESVNRQFATLFETLFGGGEARLALVDAEDPLEGGLEIIAKPPGKKPTTLSLLSGGEQTLTALALIFAVFLTNPSPICVLDEVDAPLDDANVERFCTLMENMTERTETRFLVITHHPMTMARMNRLFGVTMAERGVSQLVSVDLEGAERFLEAS